jgi:hypothetical protein
MRRLKELIAAHGGARPTEACACMLAPRRRHRPSAARTSRMWTITGVGAVCASPTFNWRRLLRGVVGHVVERGPVGYALSRARLAETRQKIGRLVEALASGSRGPPGLRSALGDLERERAPPRG